MQSVFGLHDSNRVRAFCYATTTSDRSIHRQQIEREAAVFRDASSWPAEKLVHQILQDGIHILINLNGYTRGARNEVFAARPAPVQMSFMGYAGTTGAEWCDYLLADELTIPQETLRPNLEFKGTVLDIPSSVHEDKNWVYSEKIIFSKNSFFCTDHKQSSRDRQLKWEDEKARRWNMRKNLFPGLSEDTVILGNFNQLYKVRQILSRQLPARANKSRSTPLPFAHGSGFSQKYRLLFCGCYVFPISVKIIFEHAPNNGPARR